MEALAALVDEARRHGWAVGNRSLQHLRSEAARLGWVEVPNRSGDPALTTLRPTDRNEAHPSSMSAMFGLGEQPLHTDGAHHYVPPDWVLLFAEDPTATDTLLWSETSSLTNPEYPVVRRPASVAAGVFTVRSGKKSFLASAYSDSAGYRYDPSCMTAGDQRARGALQHFGSLTELAHRHQWSHAGIALLIDNRRCLHARSALSAGDEQRALVHIAFRVQAGP